MWMWLHGFAGSPRSWDRVAAHTTWGNPPLRPTLAGHGFDWRATEIASFEREVSRLASMVSGLSRPRFVAGYSMGARVALGLLAARPALFDGAVLIGVHPGLTDEAARSERRALDRERAHRLRSQGLESFVSFWERQPLFETQRLLPRELIEQQRAVRLGHDAEGLARALEVLGLAEMPDYGSALGEAGIPITVMAGAHDTKFADIAHVLACQHTNVRQSITKEAGHNLLIEAPKAVAEEIARTETEASR